MGCVCGQIRRTVYFQYLTGGFYHAHFPIIGNLCSWGHRSRPVSALYLYPISPLPLGWGCSSVALVFSPLVAFSRLIFQAAFFALYMACTGLFFCPCDFTRLTFSAFLGPFSCPYGCFTIFPILPFHLAQLWPLENPVSWKILPVRIWQ